MLFLLEIRIRWQRKQANIWENNKFFTGVPTSPIHHHHDVIISMPCSYGV